MVKIGTAFLLVTDTAVSSPRHAETFGLTPVSRDEWSAVMADDPAGATLTLLASASGIAAQPRLPWATHKHHGRRPGAAARRVGRACLTGGPIGGDPRMCRWFTVADPDGDTLLVCDR